MRSFTWAARCLWLASRIVSQSFCSEFLESRSETVAGEGDRDRGLIHLPLAGEVEPSMGLLVETEDLHGG
jgi:hypothetical protein